MSFSPISYNKLTIPEYKKPESSIGQKSEASERRTLRRHETYAKLAADCEKDDNGSKINGFTRIATIKNEKTGFNSAIYENSHNEIVVAFRCTDNKEGVKSDVKMVENKLPYQYEDAVEVYNYAKNAYPNAKITLIGHSLGGSLAQLTASTYKDANAVTFDPYGTSLIIKKRGLSDNHNCINYATNGSIVSGVTPQPGTTKTVDVTHEKEKNDSITDTIVKLHSLDNYKNLNDADYTDEKETANRRMSNYRTFTRPVGLYLKIIPSSEKIVSSFFFNDKKPEDSKLDLAV